MRFLSASLLCALLLPCAAAVALADDDPYLWLEEVEGEKALAWVEGRSDAGHRRARGRARVRAHPRRSCSRSTTRATGSPTPAIRGDHALQLLAGRRARARHLAPHHPRRVPDRRAGLGDGARPRRPGRGRGRELGLEGRRSCLSPDYRRCLVNLSRGGGDATVVREFDAVSKTFVEDGFYVPEAKSNVGWKDEDTVWVGTDFGAGSLTDSGYPRVVKEWKRGTPIWRGANRLRGRGDRRRRRAASPSTRPRAATTWSYADARVLPRRPRTWSATASWSSSTCPTTPTSRASSRTSCWSTCAPTGRPAARPTRPAPCWPIDLTTSWPAAATSGAVRAVERRVSLDGVASTREPRCSSTTLDNVTSRLYRSRFGRRLEREEMRAARPGHGRHHRHRDDQRRLLLSPTPTS